MKNEKKGVLHIIAVTMLLIFIALGISSTASTPSAKESSDYLAPAEIAGVPWAEYTYLPSKDYNVVGAVVMRDINQETVIYDLMAKVIEMGGHDVINVRMAITESGEITNVTAVAIRYTADTINPNKDGILVSDLAEINFLRLGYGDLPAAKPDEFIRAPWSGQNTLFPNKDYTVVGLIGLKETNSRTVLADLMDKAIALGGHDIMNVRLVITSDEVVREGASSTSNKNKSQSTTQKRTVFNREINSAFAVAIKYTNDNIRITGDKRPANTNINSSNAFSMKQIIPGL